MYNILPRIGPLLVRKKNKKLADRSVSNNKCRETYLSITVADRPDDKATFAVMVCKGPNVFLFRNAIKYFWPHIYHKLSRTVANSREAAALSPTSPHEVRECVCGIAKISTNGSHSLTDQTPQMSLLIAHLRKH